MRKSLAIIASALLLAVAAASGGDRLRYDSSVFTDVRITGGAPARVVEYPPCVKGVREDRCIQLYERGVRRSYQRWLAAKGKGLTAAATRTYRPCRNRADDRCQQRTVARKARTATARNRRNPPRVTRPAPRKPTRATAQRPRTPVRTTAQRPRTTTPATRPRPGTGGTPGI